MHGIDTRKAVNDFVGQIPLSSFLEYSKFLSET